MINFSPEVLKKLEEKHQVSRKEVEECFANGEAIYFKDTSEDHATDPPTYWFMAPTNHKRILKICFVRYGEDVQIKTAFEPSNPKHLEVYRQLAELPPNWPEEE